MGMQDPWVELTEHLSSCSTYLDGVEAAIIVAEAQKETGKVHVSLLNCKTTDDWALGFRAALMSSFGGIVFHYISVPVIRSINGRGNGSYAFARQEMDSV